MVGIGGGVVGVKVGDVCDQVNEVVKLPHVVNRGGGGRRDEDLSLRIVDEPLVVEFLGVRPARIRISNCQPNSFAEKGRLLRISSNLVLEIDQVRLELFERSDLSLHHLVCRDVGVALEVGIL